MTETNLIREIAALRDDLMNGELDGVESHLRAIESLLGIDIDGQPVELRPNSGRGQKPSTRD